MQAKFSSLLIASAPDPGIADPDLFGQFVGSWDIEVTWYKRGAAVRTLPGEWHFAWVLAGRAIQDIWIVPTAQAQRQGAGVYEYGTSLRMPVPGTDAWQSVWHGPVHGVSRCFAARRDGADIVLTETEADARWTFSEISRDGFRWRNEQASGPGGGWELVQDFTAVRRR